jgi:hypothetical protein
MTRTNKKLLSAAVMIAAGALAVPAGSSAKGPCGKDFEASHACRVKSPATLKGNLAQDDERDYYVFHAVKGTKLRISISDTENPNCNVGNYVGCGSVKAELLGPRQKKLGATGDSSPYPGSSDDAQRLARTLSATGTYYVLITGTIGEVTPPPGGGPVRKLPLTYKLAVKASPGVH